MTSTIPLRTIAPQVPYATAAHDVLAANIATMYVWSPFLAEADRAHEHHQLRIAAKRLRYSLELFTDLIPEADVTLEAMRDLQNALGQLHDLDELLISIQDTQTRQQRKHYTRRQEALRTRAAEKRLSLDALLMQSRRERDACYEQCVVLWNDLESRKILAALQHAIMALDGAVRVSAAEPSLTKGSL